MNDVGSLLREAGLRATAVRVRVLAALLRAGCPVSQVQLARLTRRDGLAACDRVTLYRTLNRLREAGLAHAVQGVDGSWRFCAHTFAARGAAGSVDARGCPGNHPHFLCLSCGAMVCLTAQKLPRVEVPRGAAVQGKQLLVYGLCGACAGAGRAGTTAAAGVSSAASGLRRARRRR